jgi:AhpD family alkylhydroperoxidase
VAPAGVDAIGGVYGYVMQSGLDEILVETVYLRVSQINGCAYCLDLHTRDLTKMGVKLEKLALVQVWREAGLVFGERERAALRWAETVTRVADTGISRETSVPSPLCSARRKNRGPIDRYRPYEHIQPHCDWVSSLSRGCS